MFFHEIDNVADPMFKEALKLSLGCCGVPTAGVVACKEFAGHHPVRARKGY
jgi:hypothetical protein